MGKMKPGIAHQVVNGERTVAKPGGPTKAPTGAKAGYKHTKLGWIPEEWDAVTLDKVVATERPIVYGIVQAGPHVEGGVPYIKSTDIKDGLIRPDTLQRTSQAIAAKYKRSIVRPGDIVFSLRGDLPSTAIVPDDLGEANLTQGTARISVSKDYLNEFVQAALHAPLVDRRINILAKGSTFQEISLTDLRKVEIAKPSSLPEQRRIAQVLGAWDRAIATVQQLLAAQQERKRGLMQELLTGRRRFKGYGGKWCECELGELGQFRTSSVDKKLVEGQKRVRLVNYMDVYNNQRIHGSMPFMEVTAKDSQLQSSSLRRGDILFTPSSETPDDIGHSAVVVDDMDNTLFSYHVMRFRPHDDALVLDFRAYVFNNARILKQFSAKATGSTRYTLSASDFADTLVSFPSDKAEQQAIARTLMACDAEIDTMTNQLDHLTTQKRGLMQQLLTGAVRVKPTME